MNDVNNAAKRKITQQRITKAGILSLISEETIGYNDKIF